MVQNQKRLDINVSFEGELAQYLIEIAELWGKTIPEVLACFVKEEPEAEKEMAEIIKERDIESTETVAHKDVDWGDDVKN